jgi:hypothetical protein
MTLTAKKMIEQAERDRLGNLPNWAWRKALWYASDKKWISLEDAEFLEEKAREFALGNPPLIER